MLLLLSMLVLVALKLFAGVIEETVQLTRRAGRCVTSTPTDGLAAFYTSNAT